MKRWTSGRVTMESQPLVKFTYWERREPEDPPQELTIMVERGHADFTIMALRALTGQVERAMEEGLV